MKLSSLIAQETSKPLEEILFLRHSNERLDNLKRHNVTIEEFTALQPPNKKYDFFNPSKPRIYVVVVIAYDRVNAVYIVRGIDAEEEIRNIATQSYLSFDLDSGNAPTRICKRFSFQRWNSISVNMPVHGWAGKERIPVQRSSDSFFDKIEINLSKFDIEKAFQASVKESFSASQQIRHERLANANDTPSRLQIRSTVFARNPDVVAEVLFQAKGICQGCGKPAPFMRRFDGTPYLEVHHKIPLALGGKDRVANAIALCPNCHRKEHHA